MHGCRIARHEAAATRACSSSTRQFSNDVREVYYIHTLSGRIIGSALELQLRCAWNDLVGAPRRARIIASATDKKVLFTDDVAEAINALAYEEAGDQDRQVVGNDDHSGIADRQNHDLIA